MRVEEKIPGGKMLAVEAECRERKITKLRITGDFFLHPEDAILAVEKSLAGMGSGSSERELAAAAEKALEGARLIGASAKDIARMVKKAVS